MFILFVRGVMSSKYAARCLMSRSTRTKTIQFFHNIFGMSKLAEKLLGLGQINASSLQFNVAKDLPCNNTV